MELARGYENARSTKQKMDARIRVLGRRANDQVGEQGESGRERRGAGVRAFRDHSQEQRMRQLTTKRSKARRKEFKRKFWQKKKKRAKADGSKKPST